MRQYAEELLALDDAVSAESEAAPGHSFRTSEKLRGPLSSLAGQAGYEALLARALVLAKAEFPRLQTVTLKPGDRLQGVADAELHFSKEEALRGEALVVGYLLDLLRTFLGEALMLRLVRDVWPEASFAGTDPGKGLMHERS